MPDIFDNIVTFLLPELEATLKSSFRADFSVGYFRLSGWDCLADSIEHFEGTPDSCCRVLVGMHKGPHEEMREAQSLRSQQLLDGPTAGRLIRKSTQSFKEQLELGVPTAAAQSSLQRLARQIRADKVKVKLFLPYQLHAKLYIARSKQHKAPLVGYLGSSNLTFQGLSKQGELNIDVLEQGAAQQLQTWFNDRWDDPFAVDISYDLADLIEASWAAEKPVLPYHVYLKMAYHLSEEARQGEREFKLPRILQGVLLDFQARAVSLAAHHLNQRGGVLLGDVVGLGKTLMATTVAKIFEEDSRGGRTLIICPPKLKPMWDWHRRRYDLNATVLSLGEVNKLADEFPTRLVVIDESHNLRNREGRRYAAIRDFIDRWEPRPKVLLLTATPYNKQFTDLSNQLRLFLDESQDLRIRPEEFFKSWASRGRNESDFRADFQASPRSLQAFERSDHPDDWRDLMRLYLVRRTRAFIIRNYAQYDEARDRHFVTLNGEPKYFPKREPHTLTFPLDGDDQYARLFSDDAVDVIESLTLARYGLTNYLVDKVEKRATPTQKTILENLNRAGRRLLGFHRTNLFKRLESNGLSFLVSIDRLIVRNMITLHALTHGLDIPIGTQDAALLDTALTDSDREFTFDDSDDDADPNTTGDPLEEDVSAFSFSADPTSYEERAARLYNLYTTRYKSKFGWLPAEFFTQALAEDVLADVNSLLRLVAANSRWRPDRDTKLDALYNLLTVTHPNAQEKVLVFTQFADTARYLTEQLRSRGITSVETATGGSSDPTQLARRFSPTPNGGLKAGETPLRVLVATDVLAEGQNLQDAHIVVNFDLPWAIIRLIQRAGRVDRIGQNDPTIFVYSFLPAEGVERIIKLRSRLFGRLLANQEVIGTDESFFGEDAVSKLRDLYTEREGTLDDDGRDDDVDLSSVALQVWNSATAADRKIAEKLPAVVSSTRYLSSDTGTLTGPPGLLSYLRFTTPETGETSDAVVRVDAAGNLVSQSITAAFRAAACGPDAEVAPPSPRHFELIAEAARFAVQDQTSLGGQVGSLRSTRRKVYERLKLYRENLQKRSPMLAHEKLERLDPAYNAILRFPLKDGAREALGRQLNLGIKDDELAETVSMLYEDERLCHIRDDEEQREPEPRIVCSLGFVRPDRNM